MSMNIKKIISRTAGLFSIHSQEPRFHKNSETEPEQTQAMHNAHQPTSDAPQTDTPEIQTYHSASTYHALRRIASRNMNISTVIDVGASNGMWSAVAMQHFPNANYFLIEAQRCHQQELDKFCITHPNSSYTLSAAGDAKGEIYFDDRDPFGGVANKEKTAWASTSVPVTTIDSEIRERQFLGPFLIKLDTHGFEIPIIEGAAEALTMANLLVIEVYNFRILDNSLLFYEMCSYLEQKGFRVIDFSEPLWRVYDSSLWQFDLFFVPKTLKEFSYNQYR
jgi:FkbM family methyltransferase